MNAIFTVLRPFRSQAALSKLFTLAAFGYVLTSAVTLKAQQVPLPAGTTAPAFKTTDLAGKPLDLKAMRGKVVLIDFWATWCGPCRMATPMLENLHKKFGSKGLEVIGISIDDDSTKGKVPAFKKAMKLTYTLSANPSLNQKMSVKYRVEGIPAVFLIDQKGIVRWSQNGFDPEGEEKLLTQMIGSMLGSKSGVASKAARE